MRAITRCPACQTQFFVSEAQLSKHDGKVRCGQCLHVFNAKDQFIETADAPAESIPETISAASETVRAIPESDDQRPAQLDEKHDEWPPISKHLLSDDKFAHQELEHISEQVELSVTHDEIEAFTAETSPEAIYSESYSDEPDADDRIIVDSHDFDDISGSANNQQVRDLNDITKLTFVADKDGDYFSDLAKKSKRSAQKSIKNTPYQPRRWPWLLGSLMLLLAALAQSLYFLRNEIVIYYPNAKPYLLQACQTLNCSVSLPQQIEYILIDDSDMQEDEQHARLMHFSSSLINKAPFNQAYPNLELTLTDMDDNPILRRLFKPGEYLPPNTNIASGFRAGEEIKIRLTITTQGTPVAGYRVYVTY